MNTITLKAYAKINLALDVLRRRADGYHDVSMIMQTVTLHDKIEMKKTAAHSITLSSNIPYLSNNENNLVYIAAQNFMQNYSINRGVYIHLEKRIPISAGLAGGSADASATLIGLNELFGMKIPLSELQVLGRKIGADVPFCLQKGTALAEGTGEILTSLKNAPACFCLIVKPPFGVSTKAVYENLVLNENTKHPDIREMIKAIEKGDLHLMASLLYNVLEENVAKENPVILDIKDQMIRYGALGTLMSGSGPSVFGLFKDKDIAQKAYYEFKVGMHGKQTFLTGFYNI